MGGLLIARTEHLSALGRDCAWLAAATAVTRFALRSRFLYDIDSVNFAIALHRFDPSVHQPHPPGYFLYILLGRLSERAFHDDNSALVAISIAASCGAVVWIYRLASEWFGAAAARFAGLIFVVSPLAWFHGTVALTYSVEAFFSALTAHICWRVYRGEPRFALAAAATLALACGFRQSSVLVLAPLVAFCLLRTPLRWRLSAVFVFGLVTAAWLIPMLEYAGGAGSYVSSLWSLWQLVPARQTVLNSSVVKSLARAAVVSWICVLGAGTAALLPVWAAVFQDRRQSPFDSGIKTFTGVWLLPGLLLFTFVYLKFVNSGYLLVLMPPLCIWLGRWASEWHSRSELSSGTKALVAASAIGINAAIYLFAPFYFSHASVNRTQRELDSALEALRESSTPRRTLIVGFDSHFLGYRHAGYYLPEYVVVQYPEVPLHSGTGVVAMQNRNTQLLEHLDVGSFQEFVLFPLPSSEKEYGAYVQDIRARFPAGVLRVTTQNGIELVRGPVSAIAVLLPHAVASTN